MSTHTTFTLVDAKNGNLAFKIFMFEDNSCFDHIQRNNYYSLIWFTHGTGKIKADFSEYPVVENSLFAFSPYQPFMLSGNQPVGGIVLQFHPDFFCIHKHQSEVACNGILFNNIYSPPFILIDETAGSNLQMLITQMKTELQDPKLAQYDFLISYLKIFLITTSRLKTVQQPEILESLTGSNRPQILEHLKNAIEKNFKTKHTASDYAKMLNISTTALAKITKTHFNKTLTNLISERIIIEAKRELYLSNKTIKEIAYELGYEDEFYFSRFFKTNADISPQMYRNSVGFARAV